jgi:hypothetical protein
MKAPSLIAFIILLIAAMYGCKKDQNSNFGLKGQVTDGDTGESLADAQIEVEKQVVTSGVFGNVFQHAATTQTDALGNYSCTWPRENFAALRMIAEKNNYISTEKGLDVDAFKKEDFEYITQDVQLYKEAFIQVRLQHSGVINNQDQLDFTFLNANFACNCCSNGWRSFEGGQVDTTFTCRLYGNRWIKYQAQTTIAFVDSIFVDSVYCPAFDTTAILINY